MSDSETTSALKNDDRLNKYLKDFEQSLDIPPALKENREKLPIFQKRQEIISKIRENKFLLIKGETGSGKTTQVPQYIIEDYCLNNEGSQINVLVTQPRRISAVTNANR